MNAKFVKWVVASLRDETMSDNDLMEHFTNNGINESDAEFYISQRADAMKENFKLKTR